MKDAKNHLLFFIVFFNVLSANPTSFSVVAGSASLMQEGAVLEIQTSDRAVLEWNSFSIQTGETTRFLQPSENATLLNRVTGAEISQIFGHLESNGHIYLVNPNGVVIGKEGKIDAASFIGSTLDFKTAEFLSKGDLHLVGESLGGITHLGVIETRGGPVVLAAHRVEMEGSIVASESTVSISAAHEILLNPTGETLLYIRPDRSSGGISQNGSIEALKVELQSTGAIPLAINLGGMIDAHSVVHEGGKIYLRAGGGEIVVQKSARLSAPEGTIQLDEGKVLTSSGCFDVTGERGGKVHFFAEEIDIIGGVIDASGKRGGGEILIGGDRTRDVPGRLYSKQTNVREGVSIRADATERGDGGTIVTWANNTMRFDAEMSAQSFGPKGDAGFAEVSGGKELWISSHPNLSSVGGRMGTLLLDPEGAVTIDSSSSSGPNTYGDAYISTQLAMSSLTIDTANATGGGTPTITMNPGVNISWDAATTLTLQAEQGVYLGEGTISGGAGSIAIFTPQPMGTPQGGSFITFEGPTLQTTSGNITLSAQCTSGNAIELTALEAISTETGAISITGVAQNGIGIYYVTDLGSGISVTGNGSLSLMGTGTSQGIYFGSIQPTSASSQDMIFIGTATEGTYGISFNDSASFTATGSGNIIFEGSLTNTADSSNCAGFAVIEAALNVSASGSGSISVTGSMSGTTLTDCGGIGLLSLVGSGVSLSVGSGTITLNGTIAGTSGDNNYGIYMASANPPDISSSNNGSLNMTADASGVLNGDTNMGFIPPAISPGFNPSGFNDVSLSCLGGAAGTGNDSVDAIFNITSGSFTLESTAPSGSGFNLTDSVFDITNDITMTALNGDASFTTTSIEGGGSFTLQVNQGSFTIDSASLISSTGTSIIISGDCTINGTGTGPSFYPNASFELQAGGTLNLNGGFLMSLLGNYPTTLQGGEVTMGGDFTLQQEGGSLGEAGSLILNSPVQITGGTTISGSDYGGIALPLVFNDSIVSSGGAQTLSISLDTAPLTFYGDVGTETNPFSALNFSTTDTTTGIQLAGVNLYGNSVSLSGLMTLSTGASSITAKTGTIALGTLVGREDLTLNVPTQTLTLPATLGLSGSYLGNLTINCGEMIQGTILDGITMYVNSVTFNSLVTLTGAPSTINTNNGNVIFREMLTEIQNFNFNTGAGAVQFLAGAAIGNSDCTLTGSNFIFGGSFTAVGGGGLGNITFNASQNLTFNDNASMSTTGTGTITLLSTGGAVSLGNNITIQTVDGNLLVGAGTNFSTGSGTVIQTTGSATNLTLLADNANPNPPNIGSGHFSFSPGGTFSSNGIVSFYSNVPQGNTFPTVLNGLPYTQGTYNPFTGVYGPSANEYIGFWYDVAPFPPDPSYEVVYKGAPNIPPIASSTLQQVSIAVTEPVSSPPQVSAQSTQNAVHGQTVPSPKNACKGAPSVSIRVGG